MKRCDINIRDPFVLCDGGKYYLYGTRAKNSVSKGRGFDVFISDALDGEWSEPVEVLDSTQCGLGRGENWAPEVHKYKGKYYMFATFRQPTELRGTYILSSDRPDGRFEPHSEGCITPSDWHSLDGTFFISDAGVPYMVFCHEWVQIGRGTIEAVELTPDLKKPTGKPFTLIDSSKASWVKPEYKDVVTDGPFLYRTADGSLLMIWSSFSGGYITSVWKSSDGTLTGEWKELPGMLFDRDGGHGMLFRDKNGALTLSLHSPNSNGQERPVFIPVNEDAARGLVKAE